MKARTEGERKAYIVKEQGEIIRKALEEWGTL